MHFLVSEVPLYIWDANLRMVGQPRQRARKNHCGIFGKFPGYSSRFFQQWQKRDIGFPRAIWRGRVPRTDPHVHDGFGSGFRVSSLCLKFSCFVVSGLGFRVQSSNFKVQGLEFTVQGLDSYV